MANAFVQFDLADKMDSVGGNTWLDKLNSSDESMTHIFYLCGVLYGTLAVLWIVLSRMNLTKEGTEIHTGLVCITFCSMAMGMNVLNKSLVTALSAPCLITAIQMFSTVASLVVLQYSKLCEIEPTKHKVWLIVPLVFAGMLISSLFTFKYMNLSMFTIVRNLAPMVCLPIEIAMMPAGKGPQVSNGMIFGMVAMLAGAIAYGFDSTATTFLGVVCVTLNMVLGITDRLIQRRLMTEECKDLPTEACAFLNNFVGMIPSIALAVMMGEMASAAQTKAAAWTDPKILILLALSCAIGLGISYFGLATQRAVSATSVMILQNVQRVAVILVGVFFFGDSIDTWHAQAGVLLSIGGCVAYSKAQMDLKNEAAKAAKEGTPLVEEGKKSNV